MARFIIPACLSKPVAIDKNRAQQIILPAQAIEAASLDGDVLSFVIASGSECHVIRRPSLNTASQRALFIPKKIQLIDGSDLRNVQDAKWVGPREPSQPSEVLLSLKGAFRFLAESPADGTKGLREPQLGALHSILGYWTTDPKQPATIVMPTGTGKTETMLAVFAEQRIERLLVIVPSDTLRHQVASKFETFGVLQEFGVLEQTALRPVVGRLRHAFTSPNSAIEFAELCNVVVATPNALMASTETVRTKFLATFSHLFVDEAHHVAASTWNAIRESFSGRHVVQFTATPFREDGRHLGGRLVYAFPLREAQKQKYFSEIQYHSVVDFGDADRAIATAALQHLRDDVAAGYDHLLMARVGRIGRATDLLPLYQELAGDLQPVVLHSSLPMSTRREALDRLAARQSRIIICVDMLGEGFDLPSLKVAAIHDAHKSLGVTLQFVGRFARVSNAPIGNAKVVVGRPEMGYDGTLRKLYAEDPDWNVIIRELSEGAVGEQQEINEFEAAFGALPEEVSMRNLLPRMSAVVYRTTAATDWKPHAAVEHFGEEQILTNPIPTNERDHVAWFVTEIRGEVRWGDIQSIEDVAHNLYVLYWDESRQLLYINSSDTESFHEDLAKSVCGDNVERIRGEAVYRVMAHVKRLVPTNVGVLDIRNRARRFSMHVGADVTEGFPVAEAQTKTKTNIFAYGFEDGRRISIGGSLKGRVWSYRIASSLKQWVDWCNHVGGKLIDASVNIDAVMESFIRPQVLQARPNLVVLGAEWPWELFLSTSEETRVESGGSEHPIVDAELVIASTANDGPILFNVVTPTWVACYKATFGPNSILYEAIGQEVNVLSRRTSQPLSAFLAKVGLTFHLERDTSIVPPGLLLAPNRTLPPFDPAKLEPLDWTGINLRKESQGPNRDQDSIQARAIQFVLGCAEWDLLMDDDGAGEIADVVALRADAQELHAMLVHCKFSSEDTPGGRIVDLYEVCGQAQKSVRWRRSVDHMFRHLIRREKNRARNLGRTGFIKGDAGLLHQLHDRAGLLRPRFTIAIAQPGLSKAAASDSQLELLASTEIYLQETALASFTVYCHA